MKEKKKVDVDAVLPLVEEVLDWMMCNDYECGQQGSEIYEKLHSLKKQLISEEKKV